MKAIREYGNQLLPAPPMWPFTPSDQEFLMWCSGFLIWLVSGIAPAQWVKDPTLPQLHRSQIGLGFNPWPGNLYMPPLVWPKKEKKKKTGCT